MFAGQAAVLGHELPAGQLVRKLAVEALDLLPPDAFAGSDPVVAVKDALL